MNVGGEEVHIECFTFPKVNATEFESSKFNSTTCVRRRLSILQPSEVQGPVEGTPPSAVGGGRERLARDGQQFAHLT